MVLVVEARSLSQRVALPKSRQEGLLYVPHTGLAISAFLRSVPELLLYTIKQQTMHMTCPVRGFADLARCEHIYIYLSCLDEAAHTYCQTCLRPELGEKHAHLTCQDLYHILCAWFRKNISARRLPQCYKPQHSTSQDPGLRTPPFLRTLPPEEPAGVKGVGGLSLNPLPNVMAQYLKMRSINKKGFIVFGVLEVQVSLNGVSSGL